MPKYRISIEKYPTEFFPLEVIEVESREEADEYARRLTVARTRVEPIKEAPVEEPKAPVEDLEEEAPAPKSEAPKKRRKRKSV